MTQLKTHSRSTIPWSENRLPATGAGRASVAGATDIGLLRAIDLLELTGRRRDHVLGRLALARLGEHIDDDVLRDALGGLVAGRTGPGVEAGGLERLLVREIPRLRVPHRVVVVAVE